MTQDNKAAWLDFEELVYAIMRGYVDEATNKQERVPRGIAMLIAKNIVKDSKAKAHVGRKDVKRTCENCRHSEFFDPEDCAKCRRDPPTVAGNGWPSVKRHDWCSRHEFPKDSRCATTT